MQTKQKISLGRDVLVESGRIREPRRTAMWLAVSRFMVMS